jgi:hypothetical protein
VVGEKIIIIIFLKKNLGVPWIDKKEKQIIKIFGCAVRPTWLRHYLHYNLYFLNHYLS